MTDHAISTADLRTLREAYDADPRNRLMTNAVATTAVDRIALDRAIVTSIDTSVSNRLDDWKPTNQKQSGRCWLFAGTNLLRAAAAKKLGVTDFEFSQNHLLFFDKLEKANYFLESMIDLADRDVDDRTVHHLLSDPIGDGGQWNMFVALVRKHGLVPKSAMPETESSSKTHAMDRNLERLLRQGARDIRVAVAAGGDPQAVKNETLAAVHRVLTIHLGVPPETFDWQWRDDDKEFHRTGTMTPLEFAAAYVDVDLDDYVCVVNDPRPSSPFGRTFTVDRLGNVMGAPAVTYLNAEIDVLKKATADSIVAGEPVWFGCDTGQQSDRETGYWDAALFDYGSVYGIEFTLDKSERLLHGDSLMTHAMLFTGVDLDENGAPRRWRVENSWGDEKADKGFHTMNDNWFDEYVGEVAVHKDRLPAEYRAALDAEPIVLPAWDPMGALA